MKLVPAHVPVAGPSRAMKVPPSAEATLRTGLRVIAVRRPSVPRVELRLRVPAGKVHDRGDGARAMLLPETILAGTADRSSVEIASELQRLGASLDAGSQADAMIFSGACLAHNLTAFLDLLAHVIIEPAFPAHEVEVARDRVAQEILINTSAPGVILGIADRKRMFGRHRYGRPLPKPDAVRRVGAAPIRAFHGAATLPRGSTLILVGDLQPAKAIERVEAALSGWRSRTKPQDVAQPGSSPSGLPILIVDRPGSVQTNMILSGPAVPRNDPAYPALAVANVALGGYFSSRLFRHVREEKGYTYGIRSSVEHRRGASTFHVTTSVATDVTAPALHEVRYQLGRMIALPLEPAELDAARRWLAGNTMLVVQTQAGLASYLDMLVASGLGLDYLRDLATMLERVTLEDARQAAARFCSPRALTTTMVGDARAIAGRLEPFDPVEVRPDP